MAAIKDANNLFPVFLWRRKDARPTGTRKSDLSHRTLQERINREQTGAERKHDQCGQQVGKRVSFYKLIGITDNAHQRFTIGCPIRNKHRNRDHQCKGSRRQADDQQKAAKALQAADKIGICGRRRDPEAGEKVDDFSNVR